MKYTCTNPDCEGPVFTSLDLDFKRTLGPIRHLQPGDCEPEEGERACPICGQTETIEEYHHEI